MRLSRIFVLLLCPLLPFVSYAQDAPLASSLTPPPSSKYVAGRVLVRFRPGISKTTQALVHQQAGAVRTRKFEHVPALEVAELADSVTVRQAIVQYRKNPAVMYAEPDFYLHADGSPDDPLFTLLWGMNNTGQQNGTPGADIGVLNAWTLTTGSNGVAVGILDTGITVDHPDLAPNLLPGTFMVDGEITDFIGHGTHVAGTIGAIGDNGVGVAGVNWQVSMVPCKFINFNGGITSDAIACLDFIAGLKDQGLNIIATNNSWGGTEFSFSLQDAIRAQMDRGILFIAAAGNNGEDNDIHPHFPASYDLANIISVAATDRDDRLATFSNFGRAVHLGAPGVGVVSTFPFTTYTTLSGTSMATPHVTGVAALLKAYQPGLDWRAIKNRILAGGDAVSSLNSTTATGNRLNAFGALTCTNKPVLARLQPRNDVVTTVAGAHVNLQMLNINCDQPAGNLTVTVQPGGQTITLLDDGASPDQAAGDGIYSADFIAPGSGTVTLSFPNGDTVTVMVLRAYMFQNTAFSPRTITGTSLALGDDESKAIDLPFPIHFGGNTVQRLFVNSNGYVTLDYAYNSAAVLPMPFPTTGSIIAPWWDDWFPIFDSPDNVFWAVNGTAPSREIVIEWRHLPYFVEVGPAGNGATFQVVFFEDRDDVLFNYLTVDVLNTFVDVPGGGSGSVGIQIGPTAGTQFSFVPFFFNPSNPAPLKANMSLLWQLAPVDISLSVDPLLQKLYVGSLPVTFPTIVKSLFGFTGPVTVSCGQGAPGTCTGGTINPSAFGTEVDVQAADTVPGTYTFGINATNAQLGITHQQMVTLNVVDYQVTSPTPSQLSVANGGTGSFAFQVTAAGPFNGAILLSCHGVAGVTCSFSPSATVSPTSGAPVNVMVTVQVAPKSTPGSYSLQILGQVDGATRSQTLALTITANTDFLVFPAATDVGGEISQPNLVNVTVDQQDGYTGTVQLSCSVAPAGPPCSISPSSISSFPTQAVLSISGMNSPPGTYQVTVTGDDGAHKHSVVINYRIGAWTLTGPSSIHAYGGAGIVPAFLLGWSGSPAGPVTISCVVPANVFCSPNPSQITNFFQNPMGIGPLLFVNAALPNFPLTLVISQNGVPVRSLTVPVIAQGFTLTAGPATVQTVAVGQVSAPFDLTLTPWGGYNLPTTISLCGSFCTADGQVVVPNGQPISIPFSVAPPIDSQFQFSDIVFNAQATATSPAGDQIHQSTDVNIYRVHIQDAWIAPSQTEISISPGQSVAVTLTAKTSNGLTMPPFQLSCPSNLGLGISCNFAQTSLNPGDSTTVTIGTTSATPPSFRLVPIIATTTIGGNPVTRTVNLQVDVGTFNLALDASTITVPTGGEAFFIVRGTMNLGTGAFFPASVTCSTPDAGITCEPPLLPILIPGGFALPVRTTAGVTGIGPHPVNIDVTVAGEDHSLSGNIIMQGADSLIVTSPNGGENWADGPHNIEWQFLGNPGSSVRLELLKNDTLDSIIADNVPVGTAGKGFYAWNIPSNSRFDQFAKIRIVGDSRPDLFDSSDARFWTGHGAELIHPQGGEILNPGGFLFAIYTWTGLNATTNFELYKSGQLVMSFPGQGNGYFDAPGWEWDNPFVLPSNLAEGNDYTLRIIPGGDQTLASFNPGGPFSILNQTVTVTSPTPGQVFLPGQQLPISWTSHNLPSTDVQIFLTGNSGFQLTRSVPLGNNGAGSFTWPIPADIPPSRNYVVTVQAYANAGQFSGVSSAFTIGSFNKLSISINGPGLVQSTDQQRTIFCLASCDNFLTSGTTVTLNAIPDSTFKFTGWTGACSGTGPCTITLNADTSLGVQFISTLPDFTFNTSSPTATVQSGSSAAYSFTLASLNNFAGTVVFDCSNLPLNARCSFSANNLVPTANPTTVTVTINTNGSTSTSSQLKWWIFGPVAGAVLLFRRRKRSRLLLLIATAVLMIGLVSCGGGGGGGSPNPPPPPPNNNTPAGTYTVAINATAASQNIRHTTFVTLAVK